MRIHGTPQITIRFLRKCLSGIFLLALLCNSPSFGQSMGDFRSRQTGSWTDSNAWEEFTATGWQNTNKQPTSNSGLVLIPAPHIITGNKKGSFDEIVVELGAELIVTQVVTIIDGPGIDLEVFGSLIINKTLNITGASSALVHGNSHTEIGSQGKIFFEDTSNTTFDAGATILDNGTFQPEGNSVVLLQAGSILTIGGKINMRNSAILRVSQSTIVNQSTFTINNSASAIFDDGGLYIHDRNGGNFPIGARTTWNTGSEARVIGSIDVFRASGVDGHLLGNDQVELVQDGGLAGAVLEIKSKTHRFRTRTGRTGKFEFNQLPPGSYSVEIIRYNLGERQRINRTLLNVELELGTTNRIQFKVMPTRKRIRMIQFVSLSMGESKGKTESEDDGTDDSDVAPGAFPAGGAVPDSSRTGT